VATVRSGVVTTVKPFQLKTCFPFGFCRRPPVLDGVAEHEANLLDRDVGRVTVKRGESLPGAPSGPDLGRLERVTIERGRRAEPVE
jgi:hypothetical protein